MADALAQNIITRLGQLKKVRLYYEALWREIARFVNPRRENIRQTDLNLAKGQKRGKDSYDGSPNGALNVWADGMQGFMVSASLPWFKSVIFPQHLNELDEVRLWCQQYDDQMLAAFRRSNFYAILGEWFRDAGSVGTATLYTGENIKDGSIVHTAIHPREVYIAENEYGEVDTVFREFNYTARQAMKKFDQNKLPDVLKNAAAKNPEQDFTFVHAVFPNRERAYGSLRSANKPWHSVYVLSGSNVVTPQSLQDPRSIIGTVRKSGYNILPYSTWRYRKNSDEVYGYSPAADAIIEIFGLNELGKDMLQAAQKAVNPPMNVPARQRLEATTLPGGFNYYHDPKMVMSPVITGINWPIGIEQWDRLRSIMEDKYRVEFFLTLARATREMTAYEVMERKSEKAVLMGPQTDRLEREGLARVFEIVSHIEDEAGNLPPMPPVLEELAERIDIEFLGPLPQAQKLLFKMQPVRQGLNELVPLMAVKPELGDRVNWNELSEFVLEASNFPQQLLRTDEEVEAVQAERQRQQEAQEQLQVAAAAADAVPKLGKEIAENSPLGMLAR